MLVFTAGMAFGQSTTDIEQAGGSTADIQQTDNGGGATPLVVKGKFGDPVAGGSVPAFTQQGGSQLEVLQLTGGGTSPTLIGEQIGSGHEMYIQQRYGSNLANVAQVGHDNLAKLYQRGSGPNGNRAFVNQNGDDNTLEGLKTSGFSSFPKLYLFNSDTHAGNGNGENSAVQQGTNNELVLQQDDDNTLRMGQLNGSGNQIRLNQDNGSLAEILQDGSSNGVGETVNAGGFVGGTFQQNDSDLFVIQRGTNHTVIGEQTSAGSSAHVSQTGAANMLSLVQNSNVTPAP
jgi:hypothetical protein